MYRYGAFVSRKHHNSYLWAVCRDEGIFSKFRKQYSSQQSKDGFQINSRLYGDTYFFDFCLVFFFLLCFGSCWKSRKRKEMSIALPQARHRISNKITPTINDTLNESIAICLSAMDGWGRERDKHVHNDTTGQI